MTSPETYTTVDIVAGVTVDIGRAPTPKGMQAGPPPLMVRIHGPDYPDGWFEAESDWSSVQLATVLSNRYIPSDVACACYEAGWRAEKARADAAEATLQKLAHAIGVCVEPEQGQCEPGDADDLMDRVDALAEIEYVSIIRRLPRDRSTWDEDDGPVLWWSFPVTEPPFCGTPLDDDFPDYVTHWTPLHVPEEPTP